MTEEKDRSEESGREECVGCKKMVRKESNYCPFCGKQLKENPIVTYYNQ